MALRVEHAGNGRMLVVRGRVANNPWTRLVGLMGKKELPEGDGLLIERSRSIHTHFMRFPIDVLFMGPDDTVVDVEEAMKPWRIRMSKSGARYVVEVPAGTLRRTDTKVGDKLIVDRRYQTKE